MSHDHTQSHHTTSNLRLAFLINLGSAAVEAFVGIWSNSLSILSQAIHDFSDALSLALSWFFANIAQRKRTSEHSYGYKRYSMLSAVITSCLLMAGSLFIIYKAVLRIMYPEHSDAQKMMIFAMFGIVMNGLAVLRLRKGATLNEKMAAWHLLDDILGWIAVLVAGLAMYFKEIPILDPVFSIGISCYVLWNVVKNFRQCVLILMQGVPEGIDMAHLEEVMADLSGVKAVHDTHVWSLDGQHHILTTHLVVDKDLPQARLFSIKEEARSLIERSGIEHSTIEIELGNENCKMQGCSS